VLLLSAAFAAPPLGDPLRGPVRHLPRPSRGVRAQRGDAGADVDQRGLEAERDPRSDGEERSQPLDGQGPALEQPGDGVAVEVGHDL